MIAVLKPADDRRRARTRNALLGAAQTLFSAKSVDGVSIDDIVQRAEVAKGSFYNHFSDKDDIAREVARLVREEVETQVNANNDGVSDPADLMARAVSTFIRFALTDPERARVLLRLHPGATLAASAANAGLRSDLKRGLAAGLYTDITVEAAVPYVMGICLSTMSLALEGTRPKRFAGEVEIVIRALLRGLGVPTQKAMAVAQAAVTAVITETVS
jgi:AcrR family transcriptional regulator